MLYEAPKSKCSHLNQGSTFFRVVQHFPYAGLQRSTSSDFGAMDDIFFLDAAFDYITELCEHLFVLPYLYISTFKI